jgi:hypothetical protein
MTIFSRILCDWLVRDVFRFFSRAKNAISQLAVKTRKWISEPKSEGGKRLKTSDYPQDVWLPWGTFRFRQKQLFLRGEVGRDPGVGGGILPPPPSTVVGKLFYGIFNGV